MDRFLSRWTAMDERNLVSILTDDPCGACRYNLRGLRIDGRCPECGQSIALSVGRTHAADAGTCQALAVVITAAGFTVTGLAVFLLAIGALHLSILLGPVGLMIEIGAVAVCARLIQLGNATHPVRLALGLALVTVGVSVIGGYVQLLLMLSG